MDHPFRGLGGLFLLLFWFLSGVLLGLLAGPAAGAAAGSFLLVSVVLLFLRAGALRVACAVAALCGTLAVLRIPLLAPDAALPFIGVDIVVEGRVPEVRAADGGWSGVVEARRCPSRVRAPRCVRETSSCSSGTRKRRFRSRPA